MNRVGRSGMTVALALVAALGAGCDSSPGPAPTSASPSTSSTASPSPSPSGSASPTPSPTETGPDIPAAARKKTDAGAEAFVKYFFDQFNVAWTKPEPGLIKSLSDPECQFCKKTEDTAKFLAKEGQKYKSDPATFVSAEVFGGASESEQFTDVRLTQNRVDIVDRDGKVVATDPKKALHYYVTLRWSGDRWRLLELEKTQ